MVNTVTVPKNIFRLVEQIILEEVKSQAHGYFGLIVIGNAVDNLPIPFTVSSLTQLSDNSVTSSVEIKKSLTGYSNI